MLTVVPDGNEANQHTPAGVGGSMLDELAREGARRMLAAALQAEVAAYIELHADQVDEHGHRLVVRNGSHAAREVATAAGAVPVQAPRVNDKRIDEATGQRMRFASAILPAWARKPPQVADVLPLLYLHGLSSAALVVPARPVQWRLRAGVGAVLRVGGRPVCGDDHPAHRPVARRGERVRQPQPA